MGSLVNYLMRYILIYKNPNSFLSWLMMLVIFSTMSTMILTVESSSSEHFGQRSGAGLSAHTQSWHTPFLPPGRMHGVPRRGPTKLGGRMFVPFESMHWTVRQFGTGWNPVTLRTDSPAPHCLLPIHDWKATLSSKSWKQQPKRKTKTPLKVCVVFRIFGTFVPLTESIMQSLF